MIQKGAKILCRKVKAWHDFGKPETMLESNRELLKKGRHKEGKKEYTENTKIIPPVHIADDVKIKGSSIGPHVTVGMGTEIIDSVVKDSAVGERTKLNKAYLEDSIVGDECKVTGSYKNLNIGDHCVVCSAEEKKK